MKNFLSFKEETVLDLTAINAYKEHQYNLIDDGKKEKLLKVVAVYGANASGKSNLVLAMDRFQEIIKNSINNVGADEKNVIAEYYTPFMFDDDNENIEFEIIVLIGDYEYKYGFEYNQNNIVSEWLYSRNLSSSRTGRVVPIFERSGEQIEFGASVRKECNIFKGQIPTETLVLSFFNKLRIKNQVFRLVYQEIMATLVSDTNIFESNELMELLLAEILDDEKSKKDLLQFLVAIDTGIKKIEYEDINGEKYFYTIHTDRNGIEYRLDLYDESQGTLKSILIYIVSKRAINGEGSLFIDEINTKLHPLLLKYIIDLFNRADSKAQLIYTTHDTTLLDKRFFRRDQIWFVDKDEYGYSTLTALSDYKVRSDASFEKDYLAGVYGGIPYLKQFEPGEGE